MSFNRISVLSADNNEQHIIPGTYVVFRINTLAWMTRWLVLNRDNIPLFSYTAGSVGLAIMTAMNIVLFYRLLRSDFLKSSTPTPTDCKESRGQGEGKKET